MAHRRRRVLAAMVALIAAAVGLSGCVLTTDIDTGPTEAITTGTTDAVTSIDPAGAYDSGSFFVMNQVYGFLMNTAPGTDELTPQPDLAESAEFTSPTQFTVVLRPDLTFANGNALTASDVKFSFDRITAIDDPNGPAALLGNLTKTEVVDATTVVFTLSQRNDQTFTKVLSSPAGPIVDEEVFSRDEVTPDADIIAGHGFSGQYDIASYEQNQLISYSAWDGYAGMLGEPANHTVTTKYYTDSSNMLLDVQHGNLDVTYRSLATDEIDEVRDDASLVVHEGTGGEIRYLVFNFDTMPFGAATDEASSAKALAVRKAIASLVDREALAQDVYMNTYTPLYGYVPGGLPSAGSPLLSRYGDGDGGPDAASAAKILAEANIDAPVAIDLYYTPEQFGPSSDDEYAVIKSQLEADELFTVTLESAAWARYSTERVEDVYPAYQLGWFPDYPDPDNYLVPLFGANNHLVNHYDDAQVRSLLTSQASITDEAKRAAVLTRIQVLLAQDLSTLPLLQGKQFVVSDVDIDGVVLDSSFKLRLAPLSRGE